MKTLKSTAARGALTFIAAGSALALTACGAGQISQTADQVPATNGVFSGGPGVSVRDAAVIITADNEVAVKASLGNIENNAETRTLEKITVNGEDVTITGDREIKPGCSLVAEDQEAIDTYKAKGYEEATCNTFVVTSLANGTNIHPGGNADIVFTMDNGDIEAQASIAAYTPSEGGVLYRDDSGLLTDDPEAAVAHH